MHNNSKYKCNLHLSAELKCMYEGLLQCPKSMNQTTHMSGNVRNVPEVSEVARRFVCALHIYPSLVGFPIILKPLLKTLSDLLASR
jgi:hypothetical protein